MSANVSAMNSQSCVLNKLSTTLGPKVAPTVQYVVRNIVNINGLFTGFNQALVSGNISGDDSISTKLYNVLNAFKTGADLNDGNVVKALLAGLPFWGTSLVLASGPQQINPTVNSAAAQAFAQGLQNVTTVSSMLMGAAYDIHDFSDTQSSLSSDMTSAGNLLGQALKLIMSDVPTFNAWAADGRFSGSASFSVPSPAPGITSAFATYVAGEVLYQAKFSATPISKILANQTFQHGRMCTPLGDICKDSDNKAYYRSPATNVEYRFNEPSNWARTTGQQAVIEQQFGFEASAYGLLDYLEGSNVYMPVLFDGAYNCTLENKAGGSAVNLNADGSLDVACLSALPMYLVKDTICPGQSVLADAYCPFGYLGS